MKNLIKIFLLFFITVNINGQATEQYLNQIKSELLKPENKGFSKIKLLIQVMSPGQKVTETNEDYWFSGFGITEIEFKRPTLYSLPKPINSIFFDGSFSAKYWFNDRQWNEGGMRKQFNGGCCVVESRPALEPGAVDFGPQCDLKDGYYPFSNEGIENGTFTIKNSDINLFKEWGWQVKKSAIVGSILYGELNNAHTFSISYRFVYPRTQVR